MTPDHLATIARAAHEANRALCLAHGDASQRAWDDAEEWQRKSAIEGVAVALAGATPEQQHDAWSASKIADGWTFGEVKDPAAKTHPCLIPYEALPPHQRAKDGLYIGVVKAMAAALTP